MHARMGGSYLTPDDMFSAIKGRDPAKTEEAIIDLIEQSLSGHDVLFFDDFGYIESIGNGKGERPGYLGQLMHVAYDFVRKNNKKLIYTGKRLNEHSEGQVAPYGIGAFASDDYEAIIRNQFAGDLSRVDFDKIFRSYKRLNAYNLSAAARILTEENNSNPTTEDLVELLNDFVSLGNLNIEEVENVSLDTLVGIDDIVRDLQRTVLIPMTQPDLARDLGLKPKRGVLLYGEPGTGKTTIGRALAHQMKGKFFMIDGTFLPDENEFNMLTDTILKSAEMSSPSVIFIDDADVIFRNNAMASFSRKLLSKLDGLASEAQSHVCIVMTAMDVSDMPPALVRSGRVEVWLEMRLPTLEKRAEIIRYYATAPSEAGDALDCDKIAAETEGFTPADLRGLVEDARGHVAYDQHIGRPSKPLTDYFLTAALEIGARKATLATFA
jgi:ATP-dependent 26S proteasome regulatory subunit